MLPQEIIARKRDGHALSPDAISDFCEGLTDDSWSEAQIAALAMAVCCRGMDNAERVAMTIGMRDSGKVLDWTSEALSGPILDKHSTGGVGDGVSLVLGPMLAACGAYVPMISGRGLGHTGGTLDKLESIPGYQVVPSPEIFKRTVREVGVAIIGQSASLAPADGKLYTVRDVTATVESLDLITASILSKKLAAGLQGLVMDVKVGNGAFMPTQEASRQLAQTLVNVATDAGLPTSALLTSMDACLGDSAGNSLEIREAIRFLSGEIPSQSFHRVVLALGAELLVLGKLTPDHRSATRVLQNAIDTGSAMERFQRMIHALGGPHDFTENPDRYLPSAKITLPCRAPIDGYVSAINTKTLGMAVVCLGGGRRKTTDRIDHAVGLSQVARLGQKVAIGDTLALMHAQTSTECEPVIEAFTISDTPSEPPPLILETISHRLS